MTKYSTLHITLTHGRNVSASVATPKADPLAASHAALVLGAGILAGLAGDMLFNGAKDIGLNVALFVALIAVLATTLARRYFPSSSLPDRWLLTAAGFAGCLAIRDAEFLRVFNVLATLLALSLAGLSLRVSSSRGRLRDYLATSVNNGLNGAGGSIMLLGEDGGFRAIAKRSPRRMGNVIAGLVLAAPLVLVFGSLFASADPQFGGFLARLTEWQPGPIARHAFITLGLGWVTAGLLRGWLWHPPRIPDIPLPVLRDALPVTMAVGAMTLLFLLFVASQSRFLFGGEAYVASVPDLTYAEFARKGFFEMVVAAGLAIPVLFLADVRLAAAMPKQQQSLRAISGVQLTLMMLVLVSALHRFNLYIGQYGLTVDRIIGVAVLGWLAFVIVWFGNTVLRGRSERFTFGAATSGFTMLAMLNAVNPEGLIVRYNTARESYRAVDTATLQALSADAVPALTEWLARSPSADRCAAGTQLAAKWLPGESDWRSWNRSRRRAIREVDHLRTVSPCGPPGTPGLRPVRFH